MAPKKKHAPVKLYCNSTCAQSASIIKRAAALLCGLSDVELLLVMRDGRTR